jgi:TRAP-type C4-dicarboxylate transport system substrate-binding protein
MKTVVLLAALAVAPVLHAQTQWKLATGYRAESFHTRNVVQFAQDVERASGGALRIEVHANNTLFKLGEIPKAVQGGKAEAGETIMTSLVQDVPIAGADAVPFVVRSYADARRMWDLQRPLIDTHFAAKGLKALYAVPWPPQGLFSSAPVRSSADFRGTRMRTYNPATVRIAELLGATPVDVPIVFVNQQAFDALPEAVRQAVTQAASEAEARGWALSAAVAEESVVELQRKGIKVERASAELDTELKRLGERFSREWVQSVGNEANRIFIPYYFQR